jgi:putative ABC transport system permease protein
MHQPKEPTALILDPGNNYTGLARLAAGRVPEGLAALEAAWAEVAPARPFTFAFLDERIEAQYRSERRLATLFGGFAALALAIAGLGLVGMVAFAVRRRQKEIGIRKALGATAAQVAGLLASGLVRLVAVAVAVGAPLAYLGLARWLGTFAYHIDLGPGLFLAAGGLTLAVALAVAAAHTLRAARLDPADVLRSE